VLVSLSDSTTKVPDPGNTSPPPNVPPPGSAFGPAPIVGDLLALLSALFYATYVTLLKVRVREESRVDMQLFFGFVGLFNVLFFWPIGVILHFAQVERFELPVSSRVMVAILINVSADPYANECLWL
jgi:solute carrier family 35, member F5